MSGETKVFGVDHARLEAVVAKHAEAFEKAERTIMAALALDDDVSTEEAFAVMKWAAAVRFSTLLEIEGRKPTGADFTALVDAVCVAAA